MGASPIQFMASGGVTVATIQRPQDSEKAIDLKIVVD
jgi:hypothetical protein